MEQYALRILTRMEEGQRVPSDVAVEYQRQFQEIMIDEYQDSNLIQEEILTSVSGVREGRYNIFMVGDVKQSIYRFRLSRPELFMEKFDTYDLADGPMAADRPSQEFPQPPGGAGQRESVFPQAYAPGIWGGSPTMTGQAL